MWRAVRILSITKSDHLTLFGSFKTFLRPNNPSFLHSGCCCRCYRYYFDYCESLRDYLFSPERTFHSPNVRTIVLFFELKFSKKIQGESRWKIRKLDHKFNRKLEQVVQIIFFHKYTSTSMGIQRIRHTKKLPTFKKQQQIIVTGLWTWRRESNNSIPVTITKKLLFRH